FDRKFVDPVSITYDPVYSDQHLGAFNQPATGEIGEAGAFAPAQVSGVGPGVISVFTVTLRAKQSTAGQPIHIFGDPADGLPSSQHIPTDSQKTDVVIMPNDPATNVNPTVA